VTSKASLPALWASAAGYGVDFAHRSVLFRETLRQRGTFN
jgi:hypothetical protein